jgi:hypothetical protein
MVKINTPQLKQPELPSVNAIVTDTFYRPQKQPINPALRDLASSLSNLVPTLRNYNIEKEKTFAVNEQERAIKDFEDNKNAFKEVVRNGVIPEGASPYYINALAKQQLKLDGREFKERLFDEWNNSNVWANDDPLAFEKFYRTFSDQFKLEKKLDSYAPSTLIQGFLPDADAAYNELSQRHREKRIAEIEKTNIDLLNKNVSAIIDDFQSVDFFDTEEQETQYLSNMVQEQLDFMIDNHMNPRTANETIVDAVVSQAIRYKDPEYLEILNTIKTNGNSKLSGTAYADKALKETPLEIERLIQLQANNDYNNYIRAKGLNDTVSLNEFGSYLDSDDTKEISVLEFVTNENIRREENGIEPLDAGMISDLNSLAKNYTEANTPTFIEDIEQIQNLRRQIYINPSNPELSRLLLDAVGGIEGEDAGISFETYKLLNDELIKAQTYKESPLRKNNVYLSIIGQVTTYKPTLSDEDDNYFTGLANVRINQLTDQVIEQLSNQQFLIDNNLRTQADQQNYLNKIMADEVRRIFNEFNNAGVDVPEVITGDVNQSRAANKILNPEYNPYKPQ